jgi:two-component system alkaline phosphatase synthesis response regulator PhoP
VAKIVVADDEPHILRLVQFTLEKHGFDVIPADNGKSAVEFAVRERPDLVILDVMMPVMDGYSACAMIKEQAETRDIPVLILSAKTQQTEIRRGIDSGAQGYLNKPFTPKELLAQVTEILEKSPQKEV